LSILCDSEEQINILKSFLNALKIKFELGNESPYNREFVEKIEKAGQDYKEGKGKVFSSEQLNELWK